jgi:predicted phage tail protein
MNTIHFHGSLKKHYGGPYTMDVHTVREAFHALAVQLEGFEQRILKGAFRIVRRRNKSKLDLDENLLDLTADGVRFDIYPALKGAGGRGGLGKIILGIAIIGLAVVTSGAGAALFAGNFAAVGTALAGGVGFMGITYAGIATVGLMMAFGGAAMLFAPQPKAANLEGEARQTSYILDGPIQSSAQGGVVPLIYGRYLVGSTVISSELTIDQLLSPGETYDYEDAYEGHGFPGYPAPYYGYTYENTRLIY